VIKSMPVYNDFSSILAKKGFSNSKLQLA